MASRKQFKEHLLGQKTSRMVVFAAGLSLVLALAACSGTSKPTPSPTVSTPTPTATSILSGRALADGPVLAIKMDNTGNSLPHIGLVPADVVYVEQVEGGLSRLAAIYSTKLPDVIAPVRSARETDAELLPMYGKIAFGFSGSVDAVHALVKQAGLVDVSAEKYSGGYGRLSYRNAPYNEFARPARLIKRAKGSAQPVDVGFTFGSLPAGGKPASTVTASFPSARVLFAYNKSTGLWAYSLGGKLDTSSQGQVAASTVLIQSVRLTTTGRKDVARNPVPKVRTVGSGKAIALRDGRSYALTWTRPTPKSPTRWLYQGKDFPMKAGQIWVVLFDSQRTAKITGAKTAAKS